MSGTVSFLMMGAGVGLSVAAPIGPTSLLCIERTLAAGVARGVATGFGVATVHLAYGALTIGGGLGLAQELLRTALVPLGSGLLLLWFAVRVLRRETVLGDRAALAPGLVASYCGAVGFGFLNPVTPLLFAAALPVLVDARTEAPLLVAGVFLGSLAWWCVLSAGVSLLRRRVTARRLGLLNKVAGVGLGALAALMLARALGA